MEALKERIQPLLQANEQRGLPPYKSPQIIVRDDEGDPDGEFAETYLISGLHAIKNGTPIRREGE